MLGPSVEHHSYACRIDCKEGAHGARCGCACHSTWFRKPRTPECLNCMDLGFISHGFDSTEPCGERIEAPAEDDWTCACGNTAMQDGFWPCLADGTEVEPVINGPWDGKLVHCSACGRIMDQSTWDGATVAVVRGATDGS